MVVGGGGGVVGVFFFFKQKTAYEIYQCDWSSDVCSSDLIEPSLDFDSVANATNETLGFLVENDGQSIVFIVQDANGYWWCIADDVRAGGGTSYGLAENAFEIDTLEECSGSSW